MANGYLQIQTFAARLSAPIPDVEITVECDGITHTLITDEEGNAPILTIDAPPCSESVDEGNTARPYAVCSLTARKEDYRTQEIENVQIFATQTTLAQLEMIPSVGEAQPIPDEPVVEPAHTLYTGSGGSGPAPIDDGLDPSVLSSVVIPKNITVHLGKPAASATNVTVSFRSYIANVASSEVYPTWAGQKSHAA